MIFDDQKIPYTLVMDEDVRKGGLRARFDVILFSDTSNSLKDMAIGIDPKAGPLAYTKTAAVPEPRNAHVFARHHGRLHVVGGPEPRRVRAPGRRAGDTRWRFDAAGRRRPRVRRPPTPRARTSCNPGSELRARFRRLDHPLAYGYTEQTSVFREDRPLYSVDRVDEGRIVLQWGVKPPKDDDAEDEARDDEATADKAKDEEKEKDKAEALVVSGGVKGASAIEGKPAILDIPVGQGHVVAFNFDPIHRYQTESDFRLVWNAILNWNDLPPTPPPTKP